MLYLVLTEIQKHLEQSGYDNSNDINQPYLSRFIIAGWPNFDNNLFRITIFDIMNDQQNRINDPILKEKLKDLLSYLETVKPPPEVWDLIKRDIEEKSKPNQQAMQDK